MTVEEARKVIDELESQGASKEEIAGSFYLLFRDDKIDTEQLEALVNLLGYELTDEFKNMSVDEQKENGYELTNDPEDNVPTPPREGEPQTSTSSNNDASSSKDDDTDEEEKASKLFEGKSSKEDAQEDESSTPSKDVSSSNNDDTDEEDDDEEKRAMKLFGR